MTHSKLSRAVVGLLLAVPTVALPNTLAGPSPLSGPHARALESFRLGRFPEAYGRFIELAEIGHPASARYALLMCEHGPELFGKDWDCAPHQVEAWAQAAGVIAPTIGARSYRPVQRTRSAAR